MTPIVQEDHLAKRMNKPDKKEEEARASALDAATPALTTASTSTSVCHGRDSSFDKASAYDYKLDGNNGLQ